MMVVMIVGEVLPVLAIAVAVVLAVVLHVRAIALPVLAPRCHAVAQITLPILERLGSVRHAVLQSSSLIRQARASGSQSWQPSWLL